MTALTADKKVILRNSQLAGSVSYGVLTNTTWYAGSLMSRDSNGYAVPSSDTASHAVIGVATSGGNSTGIASGTQTVECLFGVTVGLVISGSTLDITDIGKNAIVADDQTVQDASSATNDIPVGIIRGISGSTAFVQVGVFSGTNA